MTELLKTLLFLNIQGSVFVILLLLLKKIMQKYFFGNSQRNIWIFAALLFLLPIWKLVPCNTAVPILTPYFQEDNITYETETDVKPVENNTQKIVKETINHVDLSLAVFTLWKIGAVLFIILNFGGYLLFILIKHRNSINVNDELFDKVLSDMSIKRKIKLKQCSDEDSPLLTGVFCPNVYVPKNQMKEIELYYIYSHELTHYKHKDLLIKWGVSIVNALNWFNPFMYLLMKNLNEACELYCDEVVTKDMNDECKRAYMNTILSLAERKKQHV